MMKSSRKQWPQTKSWRFKSGLLRKIPCSAKENRQYRALLHKGGTLPKGVFAYGGEKGRSRFYTVYDPQFTDEEKMLHLHLRLMEQLKNTHRLVVGVLWILIIFLVLPIVVRFIAMFF